MNKTDQSLININSYTTKTNFIKQLRPPVCGQSVAAQAQIKVSHLDRQRDPENHRQPYLLPLHQLGHMLARCL